jgi:hypothetical protein
MMFSKAALAWLNLLLRSRLSAALELTQAFDGSTRLQALGSTMSIDFADCDPGLRGHAPVTNCMSWDASEVDLRSPSGLPMPAPTSRAVAPVILAERIPAGFRINYDLPGLIYWQLTRIEEAISAVRDAHGRFPATASHAHAHGYLERPVIDEWFDIMRQVAIELWPSITMVARHLFSVLPSHDVDFPSRYAHCSYTYFIRNLAKDIIRLKRPLDAVKGAYIRVMAPYSNQLSLNDPYNSFDWIMSQTERYGLKSYFYMVCGGQHRLDPGYDAGHPAIRRLMREIHSRGHLLGLHPSYECIDNPSMLEREFNALHRLAVEEGIEQDEWGVRMHYLRCRYPDLWRMLAAIGVGHDASMGYADRVGFRAGTACMYPAFDAGLQKMYSVMVRPLVVMEGTLYADAYMSLSSDERLRKLDQVSLACAQVGADFSILWHNSELAGIGMQNDYLHGLATLTDYKTPLLREPS